MRALPSVFAVALLAPLVSFYEPRAPKDQSLSATYSHDIVHALIPYDAPRSGNGTLTIEILDPEDAEIGQIERTVHAHEGRGAWQEDLELSKSLSVEDLVWHRLRYRFRYGDERNAAIDRIQPIAQILRTPVLHVIGQSTYLAGSNAAVRLIVTDSHDDVIPGGGVARIELDGVKNERLLLCRPALDERGTVRAEFRLPRDLTGNRTLHFSVDTAIGFTEYSESIRLDDKVSILLTTEKPIYQPSQTIHVRALALDRSNHEAVSGRKLNFELEDSRGNKVFKKATQTDAYGVASAEFALADEVNLGTYHMRAVLAGAPDEESHNATEIALNVERYVLPKFKVEVDLAGKRAKSKRGYRPGDHVTGTVHANYFFGKPVDNAEITVKASAMDVSVFEAGNSQGKTDGDGTYRFDIHLPDYFAGKPLSQGAARVLIEAAVKDNAGHSESRGEPITVSESPLLITAVPEGGTLIPDLENQVFVLTSYADGTPAQTDVRVEVAGSGNQNVRTDASGVAIVRVRGEVASTTTLHAQATDDEGNTGSTSIPLETRAGMDQILLRTEQAVYHVGDHIALKIFSTQRRGSVYVDLIKDGQTIATRDLDVVDGRATVDMPVGPELAGTVEIDAYAFGRDAQAVGDHRLVFVQPADELRIETLLDCPVHKPGDEAKIAFRVTNAKGQGVAAALGLQIVDEAVFALAEKRPGFAKVFFYLEQQVMKPRYEIHSIDFGDTLSASERRDQDARALFSATDLVRTNTFRTDFGNNLDQAKYGEYIQKYRLQFSRQVNQIANALNAELRQNNVEGNLSKAIAKLHPVDAWGEPLRLEKPRYSSGVSIHSAGPDTQFDTADDLYSFVQVRWNSGVPKFGDIDIKIEHDRGAFNGLAQILGVVHDPTGAAVGNAKISVHEKRTGRLRTAVADSQGHFALAGLPPGSYESQAASPGFEIAAAEFAIQARDQAILDISLRIGSVAQTVELEQMAAVGGVAGGVLGGVPDRFARLDGTHLRTGNAPLPSPVVRQFIANRLIAPRAIPLAKAQSANPAAHVRSYFPEALYINPEIITDREGRASITVPLADNITTWRLAMLASTPKGALGNGASSLKVFQDFFVDMDLPVTLTQGDEVSLPVAIYNYSGSAGKVNLQLKPEEWFSLIADAPAKSVSVDTGRVGGSQFTIEAKRIGKFKLILRADMNGPAKRADIVVREIEVVPNGREKSIAFNGRLESTVKQELDFPATSIPEARTLFVRLYPGALSQVVEGMDSLLQMPFGCFEQTSSSTYPNVLALDYMKRTKKLTPEVHAKAEGYIANGYQRLLTFEVPGGGFSWFGTAPANKILTSYGLMEFSDMSKVHDVDQNIISRTQQWLASQQQNDGSWKPDRSFINEGATNRYNSDVLRITAYIAWALENTGYRGAAVENAKHFIEAHLSSKADPYTLAVAANFAADYHNDHGFANEAIKLLLDARTEKAEQAWWSAEETGVFATGRSAAVETTGLATQALLKWGQNLEVTRKALNYVTANKDSSGTWGTTQATIMALRALLLSTAAGAEAKGSLEVLWNGKPAGKLEINEENSDLLHQFVLKDAADQTANNVELRFTGQGSMAYQIAGRYFSTWNEKQEREPLSIDVTYDRTHLSQDDLATAKATVRNNLDKAAKMVMVDLGIPPGFELLTEDLQTYQEKSVQWASGRLEKFNLTATQAILYFDSIGPREKFALSFRLRAKYPIRARTFASRVYEYYDPDVSSLAEPVRLEVFKR